MLSLILVLRKQFSKLIINGGKKSDYEKDYMKIKFDSDDDLTLNKALKFHVITIIIRSAFEEDGKLYPQLF